MYEATLVYRPPMGVAHWKPFDTMPINFPVSCSRRGPPLSLWHASLPFSPAHTIVSSSLPQFLRSIMGTTTCLRVAGVRPPNSSSPLAVSISVFAAISCSHGLNNKTYQPATMAFELASGSEPLSGSDA